MNSNWNYPTTIWVGEGRIKDLYLACNQLKIKKPLFVTDNDLVQSQMAKEIINDFQLKLESNFMMYFNENDCPVDVYFSIDELFLMKSEVDKFIFTIPCFV